MVRDAEVFDVVVAGGGPAGLAAAVVAAARGLSVLVLEQRSSPPDKACGEGLLPPAVRALAHLGVLPYVAESDRRRFTGIRVVQEDGSAAEAPLPGDGGLGIRRTVLVEALARRARSLGAHVRHGWAVQDVVRTPSEARVRTSGGPISAGLVVAADGLHSPLRRASHLEAPPHPRRRYALRQHYEIRPWSDRVEVYVDDRGEAVVTPVSETCVNVNFVWEHGEIQSPTIATLARRFPLLLARLGDAPAASAPKGAGPMTRGVLGRTSDRLVLIGDAAGFVDSISADGLSLAFQSALLLGGLLPDALARGATRRSLRPYESGVRRLFRSYWMVTNALLWIARRPRVRQPLIHALERHPFACRAMMHGAMRMMLSAAPAR